jgi:hypothetical protein
MKGSTEGRRRRCLGTGECKIPGGMGEARWDACKGVKERESRKKMIGGERKRKRYEREGDLRERDEREKETEGRERKRRRDKRERGTSERDKREREG